MGYSKVASNYFFGIHGSRLQARDMVLSLTLKMSGFLRQERGIQPFGSMYFLPFSLTQNCTKFYWSPCCISRLV